MKIGYKLPNCAGVICEPEWATAGNLELLSRHAHRLGYDSLWMHDHLLAPEEVKVDEPNFYEALITIGHLATLVPDIQFGIATIVLPLRDPVLMARQAMTLEMFFPGRVIIGVGVGRYESEFIASGSPSFKKRGKMTSEYLRLIRALWAPGATDFQGEFRSVKGARLYPKPAAHASPPIWIGGNSEAAMDRAVALGDGYVPAAKTPEEIRADRQYLADKLEKAGRDPDHFPLGLSLTVEPIHPGATEAVDPEHRGLHGHAQSRVVRGWTPEVIKGINDFAQAGVDHFMLSFRSSNLAQLQEHMEWFARDVRPQLCDR